MPPQSEPARRPEFGIDTICRRCRGKGFRWHRWLDRQKGWQMEKETCDACGGSGLTPR